MLHGAGNLWAWEEDSGQSGHRGATGERLRARGTSSSTPPTSLGWQLYHSPQRAAVSVSRLLSIAEPEEAVPMSGPLVGTASLRAGLQFPALTGTLSYKQPCVRGTGHQRRPTPWHAGTRTGGRTGLSSGSDSSTSIFLRVCSHQSPPPPQFKAQDQAIPLLHFSNENKMHIAPLPFPSPRSCVRTRARTHTQCARTPPSERTPPLAFPNSHPGPAPFTTGPSRSHLKPVLMLSDS